MRQAVLFPGVVFAIFFVLNCVLWGDRSTGAVPFTTLVALLAFWFGMSLPLVFLGSYLGFRLPVCAFGARGSGFGAISGCVALKPLVCRHSDVSAHKRQLDHTETLVYT